MQKVLQNSYYWLLLILSCFTATAVAQPAAQQTQASGTAMLLNKARSLEGRGRLDLAAQTWQQVLLADPNQPEALAGLARHARQSGSDAEAKVYLDRLRKINPANKVIAEIEAIRPAPQAANRARLEEADRLARAQQFEQAMRIYRDVFGDQPPAGGWAIAYYETLAAVPGSWDAAVAGLQKFIDKYPDSGEYRLSLGRILTYRPQSRQAGMRMLETVRGGGLLEGKARQSWRQALLWEGSNAGNAASLRAYLSRYPDPELQKMLGEAKEPESPRGLAQSKEELAAYEALNGGNLRDAEQQFQTILKASPRNSASLAGLGFIRMRQEQFEEAIEFFEAAKATGAGDQKMISESLDSARLWTHIRRGSLALTGGRTEDALAEFREAITLRPASPEAQQGLAGALMQAGKAAEAATLYDRLVRTQPANTAAWRELVGARLEASGPAVAMNAVQQIPRAVADKLAKDADYLALLASVHMQAGRPADAARTLATVAAMVTNEKAELSGSAQLRLAGLYLSQKRPAEALDFYERVAAVSPENTVAWEGLIAAMIQAGRDKEAFDKLQKMSQETYSAGLRRAGFLQSAALLQAKFGSLDTAEALLDKVLQQSGSAGPDMSTQLLLAHVWTEQGRQEKASQLLRALLRSHPERGDVWKAYTTALHKAGRDSEALAVARQIPADLRAELENDTGFIALLAAVCKDAGDLKEAARLLRAMQARLEAEKQPVPATLLIQMAWLTLDSGEDDRMLYTVLNTLAARPDLSPEEQQRANELWSVWTRRRAEEARRAADLPKAVSILEAGTRLMPRDLAIRSALAGCYVEAGQTRLALDIYKKWQMAGASAVDFAAGIGAAMAERDPILNVWLAAGLQKYPTDPQLLSLAGQNAAQKGDLKKAELYWKVALSALRDQERKAAANPDAARTSVGREVAGIGTRAENPMESLGRLLAPGGLQEVAAAPPARANGRADFATDIRGPVEVRRAPAQSDAPVVIDGDYRARTATQDLPVVSMPRVQRLSAAQPVQDEAGPAVRLPSVVPSAGPQPDVPMRPQPGRSNTQPGTRPAPVSAAPAPRRFGDGIPPEVVRAYEALEGRSSSLVEKQEKSPVDQLQEKLSALEARNGSFMSSGASVISRNGEPGFEQRTIQEAELAGSTVLGDRIRFTVVARPTYLNSRATDGDTTLRFGLLPLNSSFTSPSASGMGGEVQMSTDTFGLRLGSTPSGFLVRNWTGGFRFRPGNGPITLLATRDSVRDTVLSFAGSRDPVTRQAFGGVMANTFSLLGNWGDDRSGIYISGGFQSIRGTNVAPNNRIDGNAGAYWKVLQRTEGSLTLGLNMTAMRYEKNLRFFTVGHGGYFSPQRYFLFNVPIRWTGTHSKRFQYTIAASLGSQFIREDGSPYFPTMPSIQGRSGPWYAEQTTTGANYNLDGTGMYEVTPNWYLGFSLNANNARYFTSTGATVFVRHVFGGSSGVSRFGVRSVPDWRGMQPFQVQ